MELTVEDLSIIWIYPSKEGKSYNKEVTCCTVILVGRKPKEQPKKKAWKLNQYMNASTICTWIWIQEASFFSSVDVGMLGNPF